MTNTETASADVERVTKALHLEMLAIELGMKDEDDD